MQGEAHAFALGKLEPARGRGAVLVERQGHGRRQHQPVSAPRRRHSTVDRVERWMLQPVIGARDVLHGQVDPSLRTRGAPQENVRRSFAEFVSPVARTHGKCVGDRDRTGRCAQRGLQHHGAVQVAPAHFRRVGGPEEPVPGVLVEEATEGRGAVEPWEAEPVDRPIPTDQRSAVPIRQERIVSYGGRGHVNSFARGCARPDLAAPDCTKTTYRVVYNLPLQSPRRCTTVTGRFDIVYFGGIQEPVRTSLIEYSSLGGHGHECPIEHS